jgi:hypothetical protein
MMTCSIINTVLNYRRKPSLDTVLAKLVTKEEFDKAIEKVGEEMIDIRAEIHKDGSSRSKTIFESIKDLAASIRTEMRADRDNLQEQNIKNNERFAESLTQTNNEFRDQIIALLQKEGAVK